MAKKTKPKSKKVEFQKPSGLHFENSPWSFQGLYKSHAEITIQRKSELGNQTYLNMSITDPHLAALLEIRRSFIFSRQYGLKGGRKRIRVEIERILNDIEDDFFNRLGLAYYFMLINGINFSYLEWVKDNKYWTIKTITPIEGVLSYKENNMKLGLVKYIKDYYPIDNFFVIANKATYENPYGISVLIPCYFWWYYKAEIVKAWVIYLAKYAEPKFEIKNQMIEDQGIQKPPWVANPETYKKFIEHFSMVKSRSVISTPIGVDLNPLNVQQMSNNHFELYMKKADEQMSKLIIGNPSLVEKLTGGSYAAIKEQSELAQVIPFMDLQYLQQNIQVQIINKLARYNFNIQNDSDIPIFTIEHDSPDMKSDDKRLLLETLKHLELSYDIGNADELYSKVAGYEIQMSEKKEEEKEPLKVEAKEKDVESDDTTSTAKKDTEAKDN